MENVKNIFLKILKKLKVFVKFSRLYIMRGMRKEVMRLDGQFHTDSAAGKGFGKIREADLFHLLSYGG